MYKARILITLKPTVMDAQGQTVERALGSLGHDSVRSVRIGKYVTLELDGADADSARAQVERMCDQLLANPIIEDYRVELEESRAP